MAKKFRKDVPVIHVKSLVKGTVVSQEGDKVTWLKEDGSTSTVKVDSLQEVTKYEAAQAKAEKKAAREKEKAEKKANRPARVKREVGADGYVVSGKLKYKPERYIPRDEVTTASGSKVRDIGDDTANDLAGKSFSELVAIAARETGRTKAELTEKYEKRNPGMQRMTLGNIIRAARKAKAEGREYGKPKAKPKADKPAKPAKPAKTATKKTAAKKTAAKKNAAPAAATEV